MACSLQYSIKDTAANTAAVLSANNISYCYSTDSTACSAQINKHVRFLTHCVVSVHKHCNAPEHAHGWCIRSMHWQFICICVSLWRLAETTLVAQSVLHNLLHQLPRACVPWFTKWWVDNWSSKGRERPGVMSLRVNWRMSSRRFILALWQTGAYIHIIHCKDTQTTESRSKQLSVVAAHKRLAKAVQKGQSRGTVKPDQEWWGIKDGWYV